MVLSSIKAETTTLKHILPKENFENKSVEQLTNLKYLFKYFGNQDILNTLYVKMKGCDAVPDYLLNSNYSPHKNQSGWAEPFIGQLILSYYGISSELLALNSIPNCAYTPKEVFQKIINFSEFIQKVIQHFNNERMGPIIIDDGIYTKCIFGVGKKEQNYYLLIADPHINTNNKNNLSHMGIYFVELNSDGLFIKNNIKEDYKQYYYSVISIEKNDFSSSWMTLFPKY